MMRLLIGDSDIKLKPKLNTSLLFRNWLTDNHGGAESLEFGSNFGRGADFWCDFFKRFLRATNNNIFSNFSLLLISLRLVFGQADAGYGCSEANLPNEIRRDCHPQDGASEQACRLKGCVWYGFT